MKRLARVLILICVAASLLLGLFACEDIPTTPPADLTALTSETVAKALPNSEEKDAIAAAVTALFDSAATEDADREAVLLALKENASVIGAALIALHTKTYDSAAKEASEKALSLIANAVSADLAGELFYYAAANVKATLPYTVSDCKKVATLYFTLLGENEQTALGAFLNGNASNLGERELNTILLSLAASLRAVTGLTAESKAFLLTYLTEEIDSVSLPESISEENVTQAKSYLSNLLTALFDGYEPFVTYLAAYCSNADAELFLGAKFEQRDVTKYFSYDYDTWTATELSYEDYQRLANENGDDGENKYFSADLTVSGYLQGSVFHEVKKSDITLAQKVQKLKVAYQAYRSMTTAEQTAFATALDDALKVVARDPMIASAFLKKTLHEKDESITSATLNELLTALAPLSAFNVKDGVTDTERTSAENALNVFEKFMHGYLPNLY